MKGGLIFEVEVLLSNGQETTFEILAASEDDAYEQAWVRLERYGVEEVNPDVQRKAS